MYKCSDQSDNTSRRMLDFNNGYFKFGRLITDWSIENVTSNVTSYRMSLVVSISYWYE